MRTILTAITILIPLSTQVNAEEKYWDLYDKCTSRCEATYSANSTCTVGICSGEIKEIATSRITFLVTQLETVIDDFKLETLYDSQESWQNYMENHCNLMGIYDGSPMFSYCPMYMSIDRVEELEILLKSSQIGF